MSTETIANPSYTETEALLLALPDWSGFRTNPHDAARRFCVSLYPEGDVSKDPVYGYAATLADAIAEAMHNADLAKSAGPVLRTAREVKAAVVGLIAEHKAAPASFRAAVDDLRVKDY